MTDELKKKGFRTRVNSFYEREKMSLLKSADQNLIIFLIANAVSI